MSVPFIAAHESALPPRDVYALVSTARYTVAGGQSVFLFANGSASPEPEQIALAGRGGVHHLAASVDGKYLVAVTFDGQVLCYNLAEQYEVALESAKQITGAWACCLAEHLAVVSTLGGGVQVVDIAQDELVAELVDAGDASPCLAVDWAQGARGGLLACAYASGKVKVWDWASQRVAYSLPSHVSQPRAVRFAPNAQLVAVAGGSSVWLFSLRGGQFLGSMEHAGMVFAIDFDADSKWLLAATGDGTVKLWDVHTLKPVFSSQVSQQMVFAAAFVAPRAPVIAGAAQGFATAGADATVRWFREAGGV